jgi:hypothetical protein
LEEWNNYGLKHAVQSLGNWTKQPQPPALRPPTALRDPNSKRTASAHSGHYSPARQAHDAYRQANPTCSSPTAGQLLTSSIYASTRTRPRHPSGLQVISGRPLQTRRARHNHPHARTKTTDKPLLLPRPSECVDAHNAATITLGVTAQTGRARSIIKEREWTTRSELISCDL